MYTLGPVKQKVLLVLAGVVILGTETSSLRYYQKLRMLYRGWKKIDQRNFNRSVHRLSEQKLVQEVSLADGSFRLVLTKEGAGQACMIILFFLTRYIKSLPQEQKNLD